MRSVEPLRPSSDFFVGTVFLPAAFPLATVAFAVLFALEATFLVAEDAFDAAAFVDLVAFAATFLEADFAFAAVVFVAVLALEAVDLVAVFALLAALAAALTFLATAALNPASSSFFEPAPAIFETLSIFAATSLFAVAAPTPGSAVNASILEEPFFAAIVSLAPASEVAPFNTSASDKS